MTRSRVRWCTPLCLLAVTALLCMRRAEAPGSPGRQGSPGGMGLVYPAGVLFVRSGWVSDHKAISARLQETVDGGGLTYDVSAVLGNNNKRHKVVRWWYLTHVMY